MSDRLEQLTHWLMQQKPGANESLEPLAGDASFRRYYRLRKNDQSWIAVDSDPAHENNEAFVMVDLLLQGGGVKVPKLLATNIEQGFFLLSDFGDTLLLNILNETNVDQLYGQAMQTLLNIQLIDAPLPDFSSELYRTELLRFDDWYLQRLLRVTLKSKELADLYLIYELLIREAKSQPQVLVHRDYHSRNLMLCADHSLGVLDFQDAVVGPVSYDLVSLLRDCYVDWPLEKIEQWVATYFEMAKEADILSGVTRVQFTRWFDWMGVQRHLKVLGIFARLHLRDGKSQFLQDIPRILHYLTTVARQYVELEPLVALLSEATVTS